MRGRLGRDEGFTLIEMMVAITIIIMALAFMLPTLTKFNEDRKLKSAGTLIVTKLNEARNEAVTKRRAHGVVFYQRGLRLYSFEGEDLGDGEKVHFLEGLVPFTRDDRISYRLQFTGLATEELPELPEPGAEKIGDEDVVLRFRPDGAIDFGRFNDVPSFEYTPERPANADIIIDMPPRPGKGWIDIRPQGRIAFKVAETPGDEE